MGRQIKLKLWSRIAYVDLVHEMTERLARSARFSKEGALNLGLAVREAVINAIKHGNGGDASKRVEVAFEQNANVFRVRVMDEGRGFDWEHTRDPREPDNIFRSSGRGIFFMKHFVDHVAFQKRRGHGTEVVLEKRLEAGSRQGRGAQETKRRKG